VANENQDDTKNNDSDEIDLRELFATLWAGKWVVAAFVMAAIMCASFYLHVADRKFTVTYVLAPVDSQEARPSLGGLGGLASLAGVSLPSSSGGDFLIFKHLIQSEEIAALLFQNEELIRAIFANEWDEETQSFVKPPFGFLSPIKQGLKSLLTGQEAGDYIPPNASRLSAWMEENFSASEDKDTGFLTLSGESSDPVLILNVMKEASQQTDLLLKERYEADAEQTVSFYQRQIATARAREHREVLAKLIAEEDRKLMLAAKGSNFVVKPISTPTISLYPTAPKSSLVLALAFVLGGFMGAAIVLIRKAMT